MCYIILFNCYYVNVMQLLFVLYNIIEFLLFYIVIICIVFYVFLCIYELRASNFTGASRESFSRHWSWRRRRISGLRLEGFDSVYCTCFYFDFFILLQTVLFQLFLPGKFYTQLIFPEKLPLCFLLAEYQTQLILEVLKTV